MRARPPKERQADNAPRTLPLLRGLLDHLRITVPPSREPTPIRFERYEDSESAYRAAGTDPEANVLVRASGEALVIRTPIPLILGGVAPASAAASGLPR